MNALKKAFYCLTFIAMTAPLGGCESFDTAMNDMKNKIASIDFTMPKITPKGENTNANAMAAQTEEDAALSKMAKVEMLSGAGICPPVSIIEELDSLHQFSNPNSPKPAEKISSIKLQDLGAKCKTNENNIVVELDLTFEGRLGPKARVWNTDKPSFAYPYFLAITTPQGNIVAKEVFAAAVSYGKDEQNVTHKESLRQIIPIAGDYDSRHSILVGFQLTEGELAYNRALKDIPPHMRGDDESGIETAAGAPKNLNIKPPHKPENIVKVSDEPAAKEEPKEEEEAPAEVEEVAEAEEEAGEVVVEETVVETTTETTTEVTVDDALVDGAVDVTEKATSVSESTKVTTTTQDDTTVSTTVVPEAADVEPPPIEGAVSTEVSGTSEITTTTTTEEVEIDGKTMEMEVEETVTETVTKTVTEAADEKAPPKVIDITADN